MSDVDIGDCSSDGTCAEGDAAGPLKKPEEGVKFADTTLTEESYVALQQFSIVIAVALLFVVLFFLNVLLDKIIEWCEAKCRRAFGKAKNPDEENPAALVGSFKRYKN